MESQKIDGGSSCNGCKKLEKIKATISIEILETLNSWKSNPTCFQAKEEISLARMKIEMLKALK